MREHPLFAASTADSMRRALRWMPAVLLLISATQVALGLFEILKLEAHQLVIGDALIYTYVGQGILNGLTPYVDLFESKPPGVFVLFASSLYFFDSLLVPRVLQFFALLFFPVVLFLFGASLSRNQSVSNRITYPLLGIIMGGHLSLYLENRSWALQTETYGILFSSAYALIVIWKTDKHKTRFALCTAFLMASVAMKEPFFFINLGIALILSDRLTAFCRCFLFPVLTAATLGIVLLFALGWLDGYLHVYLPLMINSRIQTFPGITDVLWMRGLMVNRIWANLTIFSLSPALGFLFVFSYFLVPLRNVEKLTTEVLMKNVLTAFIGLAILHLAYIIIKIIQVAGVVASLKSPILGIIASVLVMVVTVWTMLIRDLKCDGKQYPRRQLQLLATSYIATVMIGIGGYFSQHFAFVIPIFFASVILAIKTVAIHKSKLLWPITVLCLLASVTYELSTEQRTRLLILQKNNLSTNKQLITRFDALLESCGIDRYGSIASHNAPLAYSKHSPFGPMMSWNLHDYLPKDHPIYRQTAENIATAKVLVIQDGMPISPLIDTQPFNGPVPACAKEYLPLRGFKLMFKAA